MANNAEEKNFWLVCAQTRLEYHVYEPNRHENCSEYSALEIIANDADELEQLSFSIKFDEMCL